MLNVHADCSALSKPLEMVSNIGCGALVPLGGAEIAPRPFALGLESLEQGNVDFL
jgi:hypothetical protein